MAAPWHLYLIECRNGSLYAGITNDLERRYAQHVAGKGARYTRANPPVRLVGSKGYPDKGAALRAEHAIRKLRKTEKPTFLRGARRSGAIVPKSRHKFPVVPKPRRKTPVVPA